MKLPHIILIQAMILLGTFSAAEVSATQQRKRKAVAEINIMQQDGKVLFVEKDEVILPILKADDKPVSTIFTVKNVSDKEINVSHIITSCSCLSASVQDSLIKPNESTQFTLTFNPYKKSGEYFQQAYIYTPLSTEDATLVLSVSGKVEGSNDQWFDYPHNIGVLRMKRKTIAFGEINLKGLNTERLVVINTSNEPLTVSAADLPPFVTFRTEPQTIAPGEEADLIVTIDGTKLSPSLEGEIKLPLALNGVYAAKEDGTLTIKANIKR